MSIRVLSYNIHKGFGGARYTLPRIKDAIRSIDVDLVLLQEVIGENIKHSKKVNGWPSQPQFEYLADSIWHHYAYGKNAVYQHGHHGNAVLSKFPIENSTNYNATNHRWEQRGFLHAVIKSEMGPIHIICLHLDLTPWGRRAQIKRLNRLIQASIPRAEPVLIGGDFNDWGGEIQNIGDGFTEAHFMTHGRFARTYPVWLPLLPLDRIYVRGLKAVSVERLAGSPWAQLSDHSPLVAEFVRSG